MLRAGFFFHDDDFAYPVENGRYALVVYAWSAVGTETGRLRIAATDADAFHALLSYSGASPWVGLGPYRVTIDDGLLEIGASGDLRVGGFELRTLDE